MSSLNKLDIERQVVYTSSVNNGGATNIWISDEKGCFPMLRKIILASLPLYLWSLSSVAEDGTIAASSVTRMESYHADWTVFNAQKPAVSSVSTPEEVAEKKREFSFQVAETAQEVTDSLGIPFLPQLIERGSYLAREVYRLKKNMNQQHLHLDISKDSAEVKFRFRF